MSNRRYKFLPPNQGASYQWSNDHSFVKVAADDTDGHYCLIEDNLSEEFTLGLHLHNHHAETFYILEGVIPFYVDGDWLHAEAGSTIHVPPGTPHAVDKPAGGAKMLMVMQPACFDLYLAELETLTDADFADREKMEALNSRYDIVELGGVPERVVGTNNDDQPNTDPAAGQSESLAEFRRHVLEGLGKPDKALSCKYFYDEVGSQLFDQICELDEYYLTRTELGIMRDNAASIASRLDENIMLVEYGSGSSIKTQILLSSLSNPAAYVPVDISKDHLLKTAEGLKSQFPDIEILPVVADFTSPFELPTASVPYSRVAVYFPGSTIGNFTPDKAGEILAMMSRMLGPQGGLLIGIDLQKDVETIEAAYNDAKGVTEEFNLNILARVNRELGGNFMLDNFAHKAVYDNLHHRIVISIVSKVEQTVDIDGHQFQFTAGEEIFTEHSHKYTVEGFSGMASAFGFVLHNYWTDEKQRFGVLHLVLES